MPINHETILYVDLKQLEKNFFYLKSLLQKDTKTIAVVKAHAYGLGDVEISKKLESVGVDALWVADFEEGVNLRKNGIKIPIIVANPGAKSYQTIIDNQLEPVIYNLRLLSTYIDNKTPLNIHIKLNSGMNRYGFDSAELDELILLLQSNPFLKVSSICSHLSSSNDQNKDAFSKTQIRLRLFKIIRSSWGTISQIRNIESGASVGYQNAFTATKKMKIALIPIGYADGINRKLGKGLGTVLIDNKPCTIIGQVSMDSLMVDVSNTNAQEGDKVILFDSQLNLQKIATDLETIPYEKMATLNRRIKRIYLDE